MASTGTEVVLIEECDGFAIITLNRPERRNALSAELMDSLIQALESLNGHETVRAIVLTGAGETFCAGGDLAGGMSNAGELLARTKPEARLEHCLNACVPTAPSSSQR